MSYTIGSYDSVTKTVPVTFDNGGRSFKRNIKAALDGSGNYDAAGTIAIIKRLVSGIPFMEDISASLKGGLLSPTKWTKLPSIYKFTLNGTGTVSIDTKAFNGTIVTNVTTFSPTGTRYVDFFVFDDNIECIRANFTGTATAELI
jgi:hypothetical protein